jgi:cytoskeletal protein RodZ
MNRDSLPPNKYRIRDYTTVPINTSNSSSHEPNKPKRKKTKGKKIWIISVLILLMVLFLAISWIYLRPKPTPNLLNQELSQTQKSVNFSLYIPVHLPAGYTYKKNSASASGGVVLYQLNTPANKIISLSEQPVPDKVAMNDFYNRFLSNKVNVISTEGKAVLGTQGKQIIGSLETKNTWILINTDSGIDHQTLSDTISSLKPID